MVRFAGAAIPYETIRKNDPAAAAGLPLPPLGAKIGLLGFLEFL